MNKFLFFISFLLFSCSLYSQRYVISGTIKDSNTGETLLSANVYESTSLKGTVSNNYGFYSLILPTGKVKVVCSYIGYKRIETELELNSDIVINFELEPVIEIEEIVVRSKGPQQTVQSTQMSKIELPIVQVKQLPVLLGEVDIIKSLQLMPGVQSGTEGSSGLYVRGGGPDQNLILLDGVPVYNVNHLFGFFSVFNADAIKSVSLTKGGFPARYGGRLSSVIDIRMKEGNMKEFKGEGSIGLLSSKLTLEGPIIKDKTSFIISGRRSYFDILTYPFQYAMNKSYADEGSRGYAGFFFYDVNGKVNHIINDRNRIYFSAYLGKDKFYLKEKDRYEDPNPDEDYVAESETKGGLNWGNSTIALRWNHLFSNRLFSNLALTYSNYTFTTYFEGNEYTRDDTTVTEDKYNFEYYSRIRDYGLKYDFEYHAPSQHIRFGINSTLHTFSPGITVFQQSDSDFAVDTSFGNKNIPTLESFAYIEDDISIGKKLKFNFGLHYSNFYLNDTSYHSLQPRISGRFMLLENLSIKASYVQMSQNINLLTNSTIGLPTDLWVPATKNIYPQKSWQAAFGAALGIGDDFEITLEGFYKEMTNLVEYGEGASFFSLTEDWESLVEQGEGESYGMEFLLQKSNGKTQGWIGYTLAWSNRRVEGVSYGKTFPFKYDRRHDISIVLTHEFSKRFNVGATWVFGTGNALTLHDEKYASHKSIFRGNNLINNQISYYGGSSNFTGHFDTRNSFRMPNYHRLDIALNFPREGARFKKVFSLGMYNCYGQLNPFFIYEGSEFDRKGNEIPVLKQVSFLNFFPYFRYGFSF